MGNGNHKREQETIRQRNVMEQETLRKKNKMAYEYQMEQLKNQREASEKNRETQRLENKRRHDEELKKLEMEAKEKQQQHEREMEKLKQQQKENAIRGLETKANKCQSAINENQRLLGEFKGELNGYEGEFKEITEEKREFPSKRNNAITEWKRKNKYDDVFKLLKAAKDEIQKAIAKTSLLESNVGKFLHLTQGLVNITTSNQVNAIKLSAIIGIFGETLERETSPVLSIDTYFKSGTYKKLERCIEPLKEESYETLDDLECEDDDEFNEILELVNNGIEKKLKKPEIKKFKKLCLKPDETWKKDNDDKIKLTTKSLNKMAPVLGKFFNCMYDTMKLSDKILSIEPTLNNEQQVAIEDYQNFKIKHENTNLLQIKNTNENNDNSNNNNNDKNSNDDLQSEEKETEIDDNDSTDIGIDLETDLNDNDDNINNLQLEKVLPQKHKNIVEETQMLTQAAVVSINVIQSMDNDFKDIEDDRALNLAIGIQDSCMKIVRSQGQIRQSIVLAQKILSLKPNNLRKTSEKLWDAVDSGVIQIYQSVLKMAETSSKFFGFFLKFNNSFNRFIVAQKENCSLFVSSEYLIKDVRNFNKFSKELEKDVQLLGNEAVKVIRDCIRNGAGAEIFEKAQIEREKYQKQFDELQKQFIQIELTWDMKKDDLYKRFFSQEAQINTAKFKIEQVNHNIRVNRELKKRCEEMIFQIRKM